MLNFIKTDLKKEDINKLLFKICSNKDCIFAGKQQPIDNFYKRNDRRSGTQSECKCCASLRGKKHHLKNLDKNHLLSKKWKENNKDKVKEYRLDYYKNNREYFLEKSKFSKKNRKEEIKVYNKEYRDTHKNEANIREKERLNKDINFKIAKYLRSRLYAAIKNNQKSGSAVADLMMSVENFKIYLEERFYPSPETGEMMSWENYGYYGWHIDHIIPLSAFDLPDREQLLKAVHYSNLRPMWAKQNLSEKDRGMSRNKDAVI